MLQQEIEAHSKCTVASTANSTSGQDSRLKRPKYYAPFCTRWPVLSFILISLLICVAVLEVGLRVGVPLEENREHNARRLRRQVEDTSSSSIIQAVVAPSSTTATQGNPTTTIATTKTPTSKTAPHSTTDSVWEEWESAYAKPSTTTPYFTTNFWESEYEVSRYGYPSTTSRQISAVRESYADPLTSDVSSGRASRKETSTETSGLVGAATGATAFIAPSGKGSDGASRPTAGAGSTASPSYASTSNIFTLNLKAATTTSLSGPNYMRATLTGSPVDLAAPGDITEGSSTRSYSTLVTSKVMTDLNGQVVTSLATITSYFPTLTVLGPPGSSAPPPAITPDRQQSDEVDLGLTITAFQYFRAMYIPTVVAVLSKLVWSTVFASTKMMEPFYLLSREGGASAKDTLVADYLISTLSIAGIRNLFAGHPVVILASLAYILNSILPALATQSTTIRAIGICEPQIHCQPKWELNITYARALQGVLSVTAVIILAMMILSARRQSGVFSNPSSIAAMASLLSNDEFTSEIRKLQSSSRSSIQSALDPCKFMLAQYPTASGHVRYGIVKTTDASTYPRLNTYHQREHPALSNPSAHQHPLLPKDRSSLSNRFLIDTIFLLAILALLSITVAYYLTHGDNAFNNFFNQNPLRTVVLTLTASGLDGRWKQLEHEVRLLTPYRRLFRGSAKPGPTILVPQNGTAITSFFPALWRRDFFHALVAFVATLSDVLIIVIGGVPYSPAQFWTDYRVCLYTSWAILVTMVLTVLALFRWRALNEKMMLPHDPNTLVAVWQLLCNEGNGLCEEMRGYEAMPGSAMDEKVKLAGARYWAGWLTEPDGSRRWVVEKEKASKMGSGAI